MPNEMRRELSAQRISKAEEMLHDAEAMLKLSSFRTANNRAYYCIFHAIRAVLALDGVEFKRHSGNIQYFQRNYIKTGVFTAEDSDIIISASEIRNSSDYDDFYIVSKEDTAELVSSAKIFCDKVNSYLQARFSAE